MTEGIRDGRLDTVSPATLKATSQVQIVKHPRTPQRVRVRRHGFTLAEVLIATTLTASLLTGLWTVLGIFTKLQNRADIFASQSQVTRGLVAQIQDDLNRIEIQAIRTSTSSARTSSPETPRLDSPTPIDGLPSSASLYAPKKETLPFSNRTQINATDANDASERQLVASNFIFRGTSRWLIVEFAMSDTELETSRKAKSPQASTEYGERQVVTPSRRRILYHYVSPELALVEDQLQRGLTRWEIPTTVLIDDLINELNDGQFGTSKSRLWDQFASPEDIRSSIGNSLAPNPSELTGSPADALKVPREPISEIDRCLFRYYGENGWRAAWNDAKSIPIAVELLTLWHAPDAISQQKTINGNVSAIESMDPSKLDSQVTSSRSHEEKFDEARLLTLWEQLAAETFSASSGELPSGFARYLFAVPSARIPSRSPLVDADFFPGENEYVESMP